MPRFWALKNALGKFPGNCPFYKCPAHWAFARPTSLGPLDEFDAFRFENFLHFIKKTY